MYTVKELRDDLTALIDGEKGEQIAEVPVKVGRLSTNVIADLERVRLHSDFLELGGDV